MAKASKKEEKVKKPKVVKPLKEEVVVEEKATKKVAVKKVQTVRERSQKDANKKRRVRKAAGKVATPLKKANAYRQRQYHVIKLPDNRLGRLLSKRVRIAPKFLREAWVEIRQVTWPSMRETISLTLAVFIFAFVFAAVVGLLDYGLGKLFKEVIIK